MHSRFRLFYLAQLIFGAAMVANECWAQPLSQQAGVTWSNASNNNSTLVLPVAGFSTVGITYSNNALTISGGVLTFEIDNGNNTWWPMLCAPLSSAGSAVSSYAMTGANQAWQCPVAGMQQARVRLSTGITGNNALISMQASQAIPVTVVPFTSVAASLIQNANNGLQNVGLVTEKGSRIWRNSDPGTNNQATITIGAPGAGTTTVLDSMCWSAIAPGAAPTATVLHLIVSDNVHGNWLSLPVMIPAVANNTLIGPTCITGMQLVTNTNTAITVQWSANLANAAEGISIGTYVIQN